MTGRREVPGRADKIKFLFERQVGSPSPAVFAIMVSCLGVTIDSSGGRKVRTLGTARESSARISGSVECEGSSSEPGRGESFQSGSLGARGNSCIDCEGDPFCVRSGGGALCIATLTEELSWIITSWTEK